MGWGEAVQLSTLDLAIVIAYLIGIFVLAQ